MTVLDRWLRDQSPPLGGHIVPSVITQWKDRVRTRAEIQTLLGMNPGQPDYDDSVDELTALLQSYKRAMANGAADRWMNMLNSIGNLIGPNRAAGTPYTKLEIRDALRECEDDYTTNPGNDVD